MLKRWKALIDETTGRAAKRRLKIFPDNPTAVWPATANNAKPRVHYESAIDFHKRNLDAITAAGVGDNPMRRQRYFTLEQVAEQVKPIPGDACEVGCYRGSSAYLISATFERTGQTRVLHLCDSFEGLSAEEAEDLGPDGEKIRSVNAKNFACGEDIVRENLRRFPTIQYHKGWIPDPFEYLAAKSFCLVHIDVDLYQPTRDSIAFFWPRLNIGGAMVLDDHGSLNFPGARRAALDYLSSREDVFLIELPSGQAIAFKRIDKYLDTQCKLPS